MESKKNKSKKGVSGDNQEKITNSDESQVISASEEISFSDLGEPISYSSLLPEDFQSSEARYTNHIHFKTPNIISQAYEGLSQGEGRYQAIQTKHGLGNYIGAEGKGFVKLLGGYVFDSSTGTIRPKNILDTILSSSEKQGRDEFLSAATVTLKEEIVELKKNLKSKADQLNQALEEKSTSEKEIAKIKSEAQIQELELRKKSFVTHILPRVNERAQEKLLKSDLAEKFTNGIDIDCVVVSIDIRRSTELMLKARSPQRYADFIVKLSEQLKSVIIENLGVFDKFTGDGILAFFPTFFSGDDAIFRAIKAAELCHSAFQNLYSESRNTFNVFIKDVGLGIGIDSGEVSLVNSSSDLTVVGIPVVYACRMSAAPAGKTYLNQPAFEQVIRLYGNHTRFSESQIEIKNEGIAMAYQVEINEKAINQIAIPSWMIDTTSTGE